MENNDLYLRNKLAVDRTRLANERTLLAYVRTAIMLFSSGFTLLKLLPELKVQKLIGYLLYLAAAATLIIGVVSYIRVNRTISGSQEPESRIT